MQSERVQKFAALGGEYISDEEIIVRIVAELYIPEVNDFDLKALYDVYQEKNHIVLLERFTHSESPWLSTRGKISESTAWTEQFRKRR